MGKLPCSSGMGSDGLFILNTAEAINKKWPILTIPYLIDTVNLLPMAVGHDTH